MTQLTKNGLRPSPGLNRRGKYLKLGLALATVAALGWGALDLFFLPAVDAYGGTVSPDGRWVAVAESLQGPMQWYQDDDAVEVRRFDSPLGFFGGKRVYVAMRQGDLGILDERWLYQGKVLVIILRKTDPSLILLQEREYKGIAITYEMRDDR